MPYIRYALIWSHADCGHTANLAVSNIRPGEPQMKQRPGLPACAYFIGQSPPHALSTILLVGPLEAGRNTRAYGTLGVYVSAKSL
jgi:hypothetical protein